MEVQSKRNTHNIEDKMNLCNKHDTPICTNNSSYEIVEVTLLEMRVCL